MVQRIADDGRPLRGEDGNHPGVAGEAGLEGQNRLDVLEGRQPGFQLFVEAHGAGDGAHGSRPGSIALHRLDGRATQPGVGVQPQVVVRGEGDHIATVDDAPAALLALHDPQPPIQPLGLQLVDLALEEGERIAGARGRRVGG